MSARAGEPVPVAVLASGGGTNLQALIEHFAGAAAAVARIALVVSDRPDAGALERAQRARIPTAVVTARGRAAADVAADLTALLERESIGVVALAGYLRLVPDDVVRRYRGRIVNVHPALLPAFGGAGYYGMRVHRAVLDSGATVSGATVHLVDEEYDTGRILAQWPVPVLPGDTAESLAARVLEVEHVLYPIVVEGVVRGGMGGGGGALGTGTGTGTRTRTGARVRTGGFLPGEGAPTREEVGRVLGVY